MHCTGVLKAGLLPRHALAISRRCAFTILTTSAFCCPHLLIRALIISRLFCLYLLLVIREFSRLLEPAFLGVGGRFGVALDSLDSCRRARRRALCCSRIAGSCRRSRCRALCSSRIAGSCRRARCRIAGSCRRARCRALCSSQIAGFSRIAGSCRRNSCRRASCRVPARLLPARRHTITAYDEHIEVSAHFTSRSLKKRKSRVSLVTL